MNSQLPDILAKLKLPAIQAPMFRVSGPEMVIAACRAGIIGSFPTQNAVHSEELNSWMTQISTVCEEENLPWAANLVSHPSYKRFESDFACILTHRPPILITALGSPSAIVKSVQDYGGTVLADVSSSEHARKAVDNGVDGLVLLCSGAGGYTGSLSPFGFMEEVRAFFNGPVVLAGAIASGRSIRAAQHLGADACYLGTRFLATEESRATRSNKAMLVNSSARDLLVTDAISGAPVSWLRQSLEARGVNPSHIEKATTLDLQDQFTNERWHHLWSAGQGVSRIQRVENIADAVAQLTDEYRQAFHDERSVPVYG